MEDMDVNVVDLSSPGWKVSATAVNTMSEQLTGVLQEEFDGETVYQLFGNSVYMACDADGVRTTPKRGEENRYHVTGRLVVAGRDEFRKLFTVTLPLLRAGLNKTKILLVPMMRYACMLCCSDPFHMVNKGESSYSALMGEALINIKSWLRGLAFTRRIKNFAVICPNELLISENSVKAGMNQMKKYWKSDPVHMTELGYEDLARLLLEQIMETELSRKLEKEANSATEADKKVVDWSARRSDWVIKNDSSVHRQYGGENRGRTS
jgi:hypothetical protein